MTASELVTFGVNLPKLGMPIAYQGDKRDIITGVDNSTDQRASLKFGLPALMSEPISDDGIPVPRQDINGIFNILSRVVHYIMAGGTIPWSASESTAIGGYPQGAKVSYNGHTYLSTADSNTSTPGADGASWSNIDYLALAGGTMKGQILSDVDNALVRSTTDGSIAVSGSADGLGGKLILNGSDKEQNPGQFALRAASSDSIKNLAGSPDGTLKWDGKNVVRSVYGLTADENGNVGESRKTIFLNESGQDDGDIHLTESWKQFRYLSIIFSADDKRYYVSHLIDVEAMKWAVQRKPFSIIASYDCYWNIKSEPDTTDTLLKVATGTGVYGQNCVIFAIHGIK